MDEQGRCRASSSDIVSPSSSFGGEQQVVEHVDVTRCIRREERLVHGLLRADHGSLLREMRRRIDRQERERERERGGKGVSVYVLLIEEERGSLVGVNIPKIEVRFGQLCVEANAHMGRRALPTLVNATINTLEDMLSFIGLSTSKKTKFNILKGVSGIVKPSRMTLVLGPPSSGKTTLLLALAGKLDPGLKVSGKVAYNGKDLKDFFPLRICFTWANKICILEK
ncbi:hypothetical protein AMTR_s00069p00193610 [Amborella trichopoda]|uniref:ABC transporter domain-containing protein n=1 Tax=Amborella trichopoda TaxID=13333 RepID=U5DAE8_AMBTC|nr:hypothetical protein AMTR_s00069p00193610 [Amborella trichopoda]